MLFQMGALFDSMNVEQNVMFPLNMFTVLFAVARTVAAAVREQLEIEAMYAGYLERQHADGDEVHDQQRNGCARPAIGLRLRRTQHDARDDRVDAAGVRRSRGVDGRRRLLVRAGQGSPASHLHGAAQRADPSAPRLTPDLVGC